MAFHDVRVRRDPVAFFKHDDIELLLRHRLTPVIHNIEQIEMLEKTAFEGKLDVYLKVNSGMNRLGFTVDNLKKFYSERRPNNTRARRQSASIWARS